MIQKTLPAISLKPAISIKALRDLSIEGWDRQEVSIKTLNEQSLIVQLNGEVLQITCMEDTEMNVPAGAVFDLEKVGGDASMNNLNGVVNVQSIGGDAFFHEINAPIVVRQVGGDIKIEKAPSLQIEKVNGDAQVKSLVGPLAIRQVGGDLVMDDIGLSRIEKINGDCSLSNIHGDIEIQRTGGDFIAKEFQGGLVLNNTGGDFSLTTMKGNLVVNSIGGDCNINDLLGGVSINSTGGDFKTSKTQGSLAVERVGGDVHLRDNTAITNIKAGGDIHAQLSSGSSLDCKLKAGGDLTVSFNPTALADLNVTSQGHQISMESGDRRVVLDQSTYQSEIGIMTPDHSNKAQLEFFAMGDVSISGYVPEEQSSNQTDQSSSEEHATIGMDFHFPDFEKDFNFDVGQFATSIHETVSQQVEQATRTAEEQVRNAMNMVKGLQNSPFNPFNNPPVSPSSGSPTTPTPHEPEKSSITDEERLMILQMVRDQKITIEEAEKLLQALEGRG